MGRLRAIGGRGRQAAFLAAVAVVVLLGALTAPPGRVPLDPLGYGLLALSVALLAPRVRYPAPVLFAAVACLAAYQVRGYPGLVTAVPVIIAVYQAVTAGYRRAVAAAIGLAFLAGVAANAFVPGADPPRVAIEHESLLIGWMVAAAAAAGLGRQHRAYLEQVERRAEEAERTREETARRRAGEERLRIARELHDSLTHSISIIKVQAGVAIHLARKREEPVPEALLAIQEAGADAMRELRATLEVLRGDDGQEPAGSGLDRLDDLVERARAAGLPTTVAVSGTRRALPPVVDRTAYRIVQEALTNVTRHAGPARAHVVVDYGPTGLRIQIEDDGSARPDQPPVPGVGLLGMRERVAAFGGSLHAGPRADGGFSVRADLPLPPGSA